MRKSRPRPIKSRKQRPAVLLDESHNFQVLMKEYELATNRLDKTDDRIIQLVGIGLAALGAVLLFLSRQQPAEISTGGLIAGSTVVASHQGPLWEEVRLCLITFICLYYALFFSFMYVYSQKGQAKPFPPTFTGRVSLAKAKRNKATYMFYKRKDKRSLRRMGLAYYSIPLFGVLIVPIVEIWLAPDLRHQTNLPSAELMWLLMLLFTAFNSLIIYVMYSSFGHLWLCRVISNRLNVILRRRVLLRFDRALMPSLFFSYGTGNWKPRMSYWLLLAPAGILYCSVLFIFFAQIYVKSSRQSGLFLVTFLFVMFLQFFALSGVRHDLENRHLKFLEEDEQYMQEEWRLPPPK